MSKFFQINTYHRKKNCIFTFVRLYFQCIHNSNYYNGIYVVNTIKVQKTFILYSLANRENIKFVRKTHNTRLQVNNKLRARKMPTTKCVHRWDTLWYVFLGVTVSFSDWFNFRWKEVKVENVSNKRWVHKKAAKPMF